MKIKQIQKLKYRITKNLEQKLKNSQIKTQLINIVDLKKTISLYYGCQCNFEIKEKIFKNIYYVWRKETTLYKNIIYLNSIKFKITKNI